MGTNSNNTFRVVRIKRMKNVKCLKQCLAHGKCLINVNCCYSYRPLIIMIMKIVKSNTEVTKHCSVFFII